MKQKTGGLKARREWKLYCNAWIQASEKGQLEIPVDSVARLKSLRSALYRTVRTTSKREFFTELEEKLLEAASCCSINISEVTLTLTIYRRDLSGSALQVGDAISKSSLERVLEQLGETVDSLPESGASSREEIDPETARQLKEYGFTFDD